MVNPADKSGIHDNEMGVANFSKGCSIAKGWTDVFISGVNAINFSFS